MTKTMLAAALALAAAPVFAGGAECAKHEEASKAAYTGQEKGEKHCTMEASACKAEMTKEMSSRGWTGIDLDQKGTDTRWTITDVVAGGPAAVAGLQKGDILLALNGHDLTSGDEKAASTAWGETKPGDRVKYTVERAGREKVIAVTLARIPESVMNEAIAKHMKEDHQAEVVAAN